jgi:hypothetical protein
MDGLRAARPAGLARSAAAAGHGIFDESDDIECYAKPSSVKIDDLGSCTSERCSKIISGSFA